MAFDLLAAITFVVLILGFVLQIDDDRTVAFRARFRTRIGRGWEAVTGSRAALTQTAQLQQAGLIPDPVGTGPAGRGGADLDGPQVRKLARSQVAELGSALSATEDDPGNPGRDRALACYDAAALLTGEREDQLDLLGAVVLAREGRAALAGRDPLPRPACQVNPLHGPALRRPPRGRPPKAPRKLVALCAGCRGCPAGERDQRALLTDGVPYYRTEGFWARTGFGALDPDLPARVLEYLGIG